MNLIRKIYNRIRRKPLLVKPVVSNCNDDYKPQDFTEINKLHKEIQELLSK